jgi:hypothetical protein
MLSDIKDFISDFTKRSTWAARARQFSSDCAKFERVRITCIDTVASAAHRRKSTPPYVLWTAIGVPAIFVCCMLNCTSSS